MLNVKTDCQRKSQSDTRTNSRLAPSGNAAVTAMSLPAPCVGAPARLRLGRGFLARQRDRRRRPYPVVRTDRRVIAVPLGVLAVWFAVTGLFQAWRLYHRETTDRTEDKPRLPEEGKRRPA